MAACIIGDPGIGSVNAGSGQDRYAGVGKARSDGSVAARREAGLYTAAALCDSPTYISTFNVAATAAMDVICFSAPVNKVVRLRRIVLVNPGSATAAIVVDLSLGHATSFGSGGAAAAALAADPAGFAPRVAGVTGGPEPVGPNVRTGDTAQAAGFVGTYGPVASISVPTTGGAFTPLVIYDARDPLVKPLTVTSPGGGIICLRVPAIGVGAAGLRGFAEFTLDDA